GIEETGGVPGKFKIEPIENENLPRIPLNDGRHLTAEWRRRQAAGPIEFNLYWLSFIDDEATSLVGLTKGWQEDRHLVGALASSNATTRPRTLACGRRWRLKWAPIRETGYTTATTQSRNRPPSLASRASLLTRGAKQAGMPCQRLRT